MNPNRPREEGRGEREYGRSERERARVVVVARHILGAPKMPKETGDLKRSLDLRRSNDLRKGIHNSESLLLIAAMAKPSAAGLVRKSSEVRACKKNRRNPKKERTVVGGAAETSSADKHFSLELHAP